MLIKVRKVSYLNGSPLKRMLDKCSKRKISYKASPPLATSYFNFYLYLMHPMIIIFGHGLKALQSLFE